MPNSRAVTDSGNFIEPPPATKEAKLVYYFSLLYFN
jgi:hypothetical protein